MTSQKENLDLLRLLSAIESALLVSRIDLPDCAEVNEAGFDGLQVFFLTLCGVSLEGCFNRQGVTPPKALRASSARSYWA